MRMVTAPSSTRLPDTLDLEGIVAKWKHGAYVGDEAATSWVKIKNPAYSQAQGRHEQFTKFRRLSLS